MATASSTTNSIFVDWSGYEPFDDICLTIMTMGGTVVAQTDHISGESGSVGGLSPGTHYQWQVDDNDNQALVDAGDIWTVPSTPTASPSTLWLPIGGGGSFSATGVNSGCSYRWYRYGSLLSGYTNSNLLFTGATANDNGVQFELRAVTPDGSESAGSYCNVRIYAQVSLSANSTRAWDGDSIQLTATPDYTGSTVTYSWTGPNGFTSTSATPSFTMSSSTAGTYYCTPTTGGHAGAQKSITIARKVSPGNFTITAPTGTKIPLNTTLTWTAAANATSYNWSCGTQSGTTTGTSVALNGLSYYTNYNAVVTAINQDATNTMGTSFTTIMQAPVITSGPVSTSLYYKDSTTLSVTATGTNLQYRWYDNADPNTTLSTTSSYTVWVDPDYGDLGGTFTCKVWNTDYPDGVTASATVTAIPEPGYFTISYPQDQTNKIPTSFTLTWGVAQGATSYSWSISAPGHTTKSGTTTTATSASVSGLDPYTTYTVTVTGINDSGYTSWSNTFTTAMVAPSITSNPSNVSCYLGDSATFSVTGSGSALKYQWYKGSNTISGATSSSYTINSVSSGDAASYKCKVYNDENTTGVTSTAATLTILPAPGSFTLTNIANSTESDAGNNFTWSAASGAQYYCFSLMDMTLGTYNMNNVNIGNVTSELVINLIKGHAYRWWVIAWNGSGSTNCSPTYYDFTVAGDTTAPTLVGPVNTDMQPINTTFSWNAGTWTTRYKLEIASDSGFSNILVTKDGLTSTSYTLASAEYQPINSKYWWRVTGYNAQYSKTTASTSAAVYYITECNVPNQPVLSSPANSATFDAYPVTLSWTNGGYSSSYYPETFAVRITYGGNTTTISGLSGTTYSFTPSGNAYDNVINWTVYATNKKGNSTIPNEQYFITAPSVPTLISPADTATNQQVPVGLSWNASSSSQPSYLQYEVWYSTTFTFSSYNTLAYASGTSANLTGLAANTTYYWKVRAKGYWGVVSNFSSVRTFTTVAAPGVPTITGGPSSGATKVAVSQLISWTSDASTSSVELAYSTDAWANTTTINGLAANGNYTITVGNYVTVYWKIRARNSVGVSSYTTDRNYRTIAVASSVPTIVKPVGALSNNDPDLQWTSNTSLPGPVTELYDWDLASDAGFSTIVASGAGVGYLSTSHVHTFNYSTTAYFRVRAYNNDNITKSSYATSTFTTSSGPAPVLSYPPNGTTISDTFRPMLQWQSVSGATMYHVNVVGGTTNTTIDVPATIPAPNYESYTFTFDLANVTSYQWKVYATTTSGDSAWSATYSFYIQVYPDTPWGPTPADTSTNIPVNTTFSWTAYNATTYAFQLTSSSYSNCLVNVSGLSTYTNYNPGVTLAKYTNYKWRVTATNAAGSRTSGDFIFTTVPNAPQINTNITDLAIAANSPVEFSIGLDASTPMDSCQWYEKVGTTSTAISGATSLTYRITSFHASKNGYKYYCVITNHGGSTTSYVATVSIIPAPAAPTLTSPADNATGVSTSPTLQFTIPGGASNMFVQIALDAAFGQIVFSAWTETTSTSYTVPETLWKGTKYYWRVKCRGNGGDSGYSLSRSFTTTGTYTDTPRSLNKLGYARGDHNNPTGASTRLHAEKMSEFTMQDIDFYFTTDDPIGGGTIVLYPVVKGGSKIVSRIMSNNPGRIYLSVSVQSGMVAIDDVLQAQIHVYLVDPGSATIRITYNDGFNPSITKTKVLYAK